LRGELRESIDLDQGALAMTPHTSFRIAMTTAVLGLATLGGCDYDTHPTATGRTITPPDTTSVGDPGTVNAGGPGAQGQTPK
jgi:hypothetical protein